LMVAARFDGLDFVVVWVAVCPVVEADADELEPFGLERRRSDIDLGAVGASNLSNARPIRLGIDNLIGQEVTGTVGSLRRKK
jgi:hypothetical protein